MKSSITRRSLLGAGAAALAALPFGGQASSAPIKPSKSLPVLDRLDHQLYLHNMSIHAHCFAGQICGSKLQMMVHGQRRYLFHAYAKNNEAKTRCLDVTDPLNPTVVGDELLDGYQMQVAYNHAIKKWILISSESPAQPEADMVRGRNLKAKGLRGVRIYDVTDPSRANLLSEWSCDQGAPRREIQEGTGTHRNFYTGGRYAYLDTSPDNTYANYGLGRANGVQVIDILDPRQPKFVSNIWIPGQRAGEETDQRQSLFARKGKLSPSFHGGFIVPENVEDGGRYGYGAWSVLGIRVHDLTNIARPAQVGEWNSSDPNGPGIKFHTVDVSRIDRGIVLVSPEVIRPQCEGPWYGSYVLDASNPVALKTLARLPVPSPPADAPYESFCQKRGRFGPHNAPHHKAPGRVSANFTCYTYFNAGLQCYDLSVPAQPAISAYFIPPQGGSIDEPRSYMRDTDGVFVEWDRRLIWVSTSTGIYLLSTPALGTPSFDPAAVTDWSLPALRQHWPSGG